MKKIKKQRRLERFKEILSLKTRPAGEPGENTGSKSGIKTLLMGGVAIIFFIILFAFIGGKEPVPDELGSSASSSGAPEASLQKHQEAAGKVPARRYYVGVYLKDVSDFDLKQGRFKADMYLWLKWSGRDAGEKDKMTNPPLSFSNGEISYVNREADENDGTWQSVRWRIQGVFRGTFPLHHFPFDRQELPIVMELPRGLGELVPDLAASGMASSFSVTGWKYEPYFNARTIPLRYSSDLGSIDAEGGAQLVTQVLFSVPLERPFAAYLVKMILPLLIIVGMSLVSIMLPQEEIDARVGMVITALLSCVALNFSLSDSLPDVAYLVAADKFFLGAYLMIFIALVETVFVYRLYPQKEALARKIDRLSYIALPVLMMIFTLTGLWGALRQAQADERPETAGGKQREEANSLWEGGARPESKRKVLRINVASLSSYTAYGMDRGLIRRGLIRYQGENTNGSSGEIDARPTPWLAEILPASTNTNLRFLPDGGMRVRWRIKPGMLWSDGREITSNDLKFSATIFDDPLRRGVRKLDDYTIDVYYNSRLREKLEGFRILPERNLRAAYKKDGYKGVTAILGKQPLPLNGPYMLESFEKGKRAVFKLNPEYAGKQPLIEKIITSNYTTLARKAGEKDATSATTLARDQADLSPLVSHISANQARKLPGLSVLPNPGKYFYFLQPGILQAPFNNLNVRRAALHGINRQALAAIYDPDSGRVAHSYRPHRRENSASDYAPDVERYEYNPSRSRALLAESGLKLPVRVIIHVKKSKNPHSPRARLLTSIRRDLNKVGFQVEEKIVKSTIPLRQSADFSGLIFRYSKKQNERTFWNIAYKDGRYQTETPRGEFTGEAFTLFNAYQTSLFPERREMLSRKLQLIWSRRLPVFPLFHSSTYLIYRSSLRGPAPLLENFFWNIEDWHFTE